MLKKPIQNLAIFFFLFFQVLNAKVVEYKVTISPAHVNITGEKVLAFTLNGKIPGPTLKAKLGDILRVTFHNKLLEETSIHWHGVLLPNEQDGVPYITTPPINPGEAFTYEYPIIHAGTYWYHAHAGLQEQKGIYGALVFYEDNEQKDYDEEHVLILSDWTNEEPDQVQANLKKDSDYYALKKENVQSWGRVFENGLDAFKIRLFNSFTRMGPMDLSDVGYDAFLINGKQKLNLGLTKKGSKIKLRVINAAASTYFNLEFAGGEMQVVESDGVKVEPFFAKRIRIAMAETYDVIITLPEQKMYEFRASAEDGTGYASAFIGSGDLVSAPDIPRPNIFVMDHQNHHNENQQHDTLNASGPLENHHGHEKHDDFDRVSHNPSAKERHIGYLNNYKSLKARIKTTLSKGNPSRVVELRLTGNMERYIWSFNDKTLSEEDKILIKKGENVKFIFINETMMHHPLHLHGHFFRVLNGQGDYCPLKHTVNVAPFERLEIEFFANEDHDWFFHCHNLYHMSLGMARIIHYEGSQPNAIMSNTKDHSSDHGGKWFSSSLIDLQSNFISADFKATQNNTDLVAKLEHDYKNEYEVDLYAEQYCSRFLGLYTGGEFEREKSKYNNAGILGLHYTLPLFVEADVRFNSKGKFRLSLGSSLQISERSILKWNFDTRKKARIEFNYAFNKQLTMAVNYSSRRGWGAGLNIRF